MVDARQRSKNQLILQHDVDTAQAEAEANQKMDET